MMNSFFYMWGAFGLLMPIIVAIVTYVIYYFLIRKAVNDSNMTTEIYWLRRDLNELERRQSERFNALEAYFQEQNKLTREQNELLIRLERASNQD
ncbi:hypothetical protein CDO73_10970 [Saccharibacillus sp. O23]|uniref:hypothetical protein n=1 Tax=Saccharibacillus sp. O23 TaxID=2009338 RepID=UPI000B4E0C3A|nr:hypothetical protein [Saccharibacillus sp. O23]OWR30430.1 hypothetical protein CDO73_10970 [Saccharibacillus sp. O23]